MKWLQFTSLCNWRIFDQERIILKSTKILKYVHCLGTKLYYSTDETVNNLSLIAAVNLYLMIYRPY